MKNRSLLLTLVAVAAFGLMATPAEAGGRKKHCNRGWNDGRHGYYQRGWNDGRHGYYQRGWDRGYRHYRPVAVRRVACDRPVFFAPTPVFVFGFGFR
jgi:hypothetical protein